MFNSKNTKRSLLMSALALVLCVSMLVGSTFAWFTDTASTGVNAIQSGTLDIQLLMKENGQWVNAEGKTLNFISANGNQNILWEPGCTYKLPALKVVNKGNLNLKYQIHITGIEGDAKLLEVIDFTIEGESDLEGTLAPNAESDEITLSGHMKEEAGNDYQGKTLDAISITVYATQMTAEYDSNDNQYDKDAEHPDWNTAEAWDGTADTSWYDPANPQTEYELGTAEQLAGLAELVSGDTTFKGVTITLTEDIDLYCEDTTPSADGDPLTFRPIGDHSKDGTFEGTFDGNGKTISNLYQNGWDLGYEWGIYGSYGLFGNLNDATVKNLTITGAESYIEGGDVGGVTGSATGNCVFENITITNSDFGTYNNGNGGIIGWSGAGNYTFKNIKIAEDVTLAGLWGSFDSSIGGIVGQGETGATYNFENVDVACRLDVYNDCTASYDYYNYRMCGMLIGRLEETTTIDGKNYPDTSKYTINCNDVTVTYGEWADYHYCRAAGERGKRVEAGYSYGGVAADYDHSVCTAHHMECIPFDQIFGGAQYAVKGLPSYDGVTVIYNNDKQ